MKVGVDARSLSRPLTGVGRYTLEMCRALNATSGVTLYLYSPSPLPGDVVGALTNSIIKTGAWQSDIFRQIWGEIFLPLWLKKDEVDVFWGPAHRLPHYLPKRIARVVTIHDLVWKYAGDTMRPISRWLERYHMPRAINNADEIVADSQATAEAVEEEFSISSERLTIVPLAASLSGNPIPLSSLRHFSIEGPYFLFVGTLEPRKNLVNLLAAFARLPVRIRAAATLVIVGGSGWGEIDIDSVVTHLNLENYVMILGYVDDISLSALYTNALFVVLPSLYEGFGLPILEAMVHGTPVIAANNSSMPEIVGNAGLLIEALDVDSIATCLEQMITDTPLREKLAKNTKPNAAKFNWEVSANRLLAAFERAISNRVGRRKK